MKRLPAFFSGAGALRSSEERFRLLVDGVRDYAIFLLDPEGHVVSWNVGAQRIKGYEADEILGEHFSRFYPLEAIAAGWPQHELEVARREGRFEDEGWRLRKDGTRFWANAVITVLEEHGRVIGFSKVTRDLTERRRREDQIRQSEARFRELVEVLKDHAIFGLDPNGLVSTWNAGAARLEGYAESEIVGRHFSVFYPPEAIARGWPEHELRTARQDGRFEDEGWRVRKDGSRFWANVVIAAITSPDGQTTGFSKVVRDMSDRRKQEETLRQSEERFRLMVEGVRDYAIFMLDPDGRVASWNEGARRIKGYEATEIIGQHFSKFYPEDALARSWPEHELSVARRDGRFEEEGWRVRKDGSLFWANVVITALYGASDTLRGYAKVTRDLTDRRKIHALEEEGRRINEFLAMLGHELRNPLAPIRSAVALLGTVRSPDPGMVRVHEILERQVLHLGRIVDDLLDLGRISTGNISVRLEPVDFAAAVTRAVESLEDVFRDKDQHIEVRTPSEPLVVLADPTRISQVVVNLLTNAHRYTPRGGHFRVEVESDGRSAQLSVGDDGMGIPSHLLPRVFDAFVQGERDLDRAEGGLGIGLTLVRTLVELHSGSVSASSRGEGQGSEFLVRLPLRQSSEAQAPAPAPQTPEAPGAPVAPVATGLRVLVVDDNTDAAEMLAMLIEHWGEDVRTAADGPEALVVAAAYAPDVILLDIGLPGLDGYAVAERLRGTPCVLVALTGYGQPEDIARSERAGFAHHLVKPVDPVRLRRILEEVPRSSG